MMGLQSESSREALDPVCTRVVNLLKEKGPMLLEDLIAESGLTPQAVKECCERNHEIMMKIFALPRFRSRNSVEYRNKLRRLSGKKVVYIFGDERLYRFLAKLIIKHNLIPYNTIECHMLATMINNIFPKKYEKVRAEIEKILSETEPENEIVSLVQWVKASIYKAVKNGVINAKAVWCCGNREGLAFIVNPSPSKLEEIANNGLCENLEITK